MLMRARYKTTLPTYTDGIADELQMDSSGRLLVAVSGAGDITDDSAFTPGTSEVSVIGAFADMTTPDSVDEGDAGALRMTLDRKLLVALYGEVSAGGDTSIKMGTGNAAPAQTVARVYTTALGALRDSSAALIRPILTQSSTADASDGTVFSGSGLMGFNGTTWDRLRSEGNDRDDIAVGTLGNLQTINFNHAYDQSAGNWNRVRDAAGVGDGGTGPGTLSVAPLAFNGTTYDRLRTEGNDRESVAATTLGLLQNVNYPMVWDNTASDYNRAQSAAADGLSGTTLYGAGNALFNGTSYDRQRGNEEGTALASAARTAQTASSTIVNYNGKYLQVIVNITADPSTASITPSLRYVDPVSGNPVTFWTAAAALTAVGVYSYIFGPGILAGAVASHTEGANTPIPRSWVFRMNVADAESMTYSVAYVHGV